MSSYVTRNADNIPFSSIRHNFYMNLYYPSTIIEWKRLDSKLRNSENFGISKIIFFDLLDISQTVFLIAAILQGLDWSQDSTYNLSHLLEQKFKYNLQNCLNPLCSWLKKTYPL